MDEYYNYKYKKYKTKYLDLKGGKMEYGLYGLYSHYGKTLNLRANKRFNEINYVHDIPLSKDKKGDNIIINHLRSKYKEWKYYKGIKSFEFVPYDESEEKKQDNENIQKLIDTTYFTEELYKDGNVKWTTLNKLKKFRHRGYSREISEQIINAYADKAEELLKDENNYKSDNNDITKIRQEALNLQKLRKCNVIHKHPNKSTKNQASPYTEILLEETIKDNEIQLLLSSVTKGTYYKDNPKIHKDPYTLANEKLGVLSWNLIINKATINCIMTHHDVLFPIRIILDMDPQILFYDNILHSKKYNNYMGFFLIRFENDEDEKYTKHSKPHNSKEQYYVFFVFKNENKFFDFPLFTYTLTNFRNNIVNWGDVTEKKTILFHEIIQLICMYLKKEVYFYLVSSENKSDKNDTIKPWIHSEDLNDINFDNEIHILVSKYDIDNINKKLVNGDIREIPDKTYKYIKYKDYNLFQCHFGWYDDPTDRLCINLGDMSDKKIEELKTNACIYNLEDNLYELDKIRYIKPIGENNIKNHEDIKNFDLGDYSIIDLKINNLLHKI